MIQGNLRKSVRLALALLAGFAALGAAPPPSPFVSISRDKAFVREGPSYQHHILWVYRRKDLPVMIIQTYDVWRKIRDSDGTVGWVHSSMLSDRRTVVVTSHIPAKITDRPGGKVVALAQPGVVARLEACEAETCEISASGTEGWIKKQDVWGVGTGEVFK
jgi:SH3-like domain-containing protein